MERCRLLPIMESLLFMQLRKKGHQEALKLLLDHNVDVNSRDTEGRTPLFWAVVQGHEVLVNDLLARGADIGARSSIGFTTLHMAAFKGHLRLVERLVGGSWVRYLERRQRWMDPTARCCRRRFSGGCAFSTRLSRRSRSYYSEENSFSNGYHQTQ